MEFLMTYGWAILVLIIVIAVLFYMGVMNQANTQPDSCVLAPGFSCYTFKVAGPNATLYLDLGQATGGGVVVTGIGCSESPLPDVTPLTNPVYVAAGDSSEVAAGDSGNSIQCTDAGGNEIFTTGSTGTMPTDSGVFQGTIAINYTSLADNVSHVVYGDIRAIIGTEIIPITGAGCSPNCNENSTCTANSQCSSGYCTGGLCTNCTSSCPIGALCANDSQCASGYCHLNRCAAGCPSNGGTLLACCAISTPGSYTVGRNLSSSAPCITITSGGSGATLDCGGKTITGTGTNYGIYIDGASGVTVRNCVVDDYAVGIYFHSSQNNTITGNWVGNSNMNGIWADDAEGTVISGNTLESNTASGIAVVQSGGTRVTSNTVNASGQRCIDLTDSNNSYISGNTISFCGGDGIAVRTSDNVDVGGNHISNLTGADVGSSGGIYLSYATGSSIHGNTISSAIEFGTYLVGSANNTISANSVDGSSIYGIYMYSDIGANSDNALSSNTISNSGSLDVYCASGTTNTTRSGNTCSTASKACLGCTPGTCNATQCN